jgi:hypothetical protein
MLENPTANISALSNSCARIRFKQFYLSNHSELITCSYKLLSSQQPILSPPTILNFPLNHLVYISMDKKKYRNNNSSASPVFIIHVSIAIAYNSSHNVMFTFVMNITYILNYIKHPNFSILCAYKNSIKVKLSFPCTSHEEI